MIKIGCHLSASKGYVHMAEDAVNIGADVFQFFTRNPRGGKAKDIDMSDIGGFKEFAKKNNFSQILAHAPFTMNPCSDDEKKREFANMIFADDLRRMENTPDNLYNFHPGSHVGQGVEKGIELISKMLNDNLSENMTTTVLLETMAGKGSEVGSSFHEIRKIIDMTYLNHKLGVCLDTCHVYDAGYDIVNNLDGVLEEFDKIIGIKRLKAIHLNDSKNPFMSHKDRHEQIGKGTIGLDAIIRIVNHPSLKHLPFYLETPHDTLEGYAKEIKLIKSFYEE